MQTVSWYAKRLASMSPGEIAWRLRSALRDSVDRLRFPLGLYPGINAIRNGRNGSDPWESGFSVTDLPSGAWQKSGVSDPELGWVRDLASRADRIAEGKLSFFDQENLSLGDPIDWNREHVCGKNTPMCFSGSIDYRDYRVTGDCKIVWEPNRHHHLVVLARAYRATGNEKYGKAVVSQLDSWISQCPFGRGMNWRSPLELAIRLINWVWSIDMIRGMEIVDKAFLARVTHSVHLHLWEITRKYSKGSSSNNHSIGEAAGVFIATSYLPNLNKADVWNEESREILEREIIEQTFPDGGGREQALGYHLFILQFFLFAGIVARKQGRDFSASYWRTIENMMEFLAALAEGGPVPYYGDSDDGYVLDLGSGPPDFRDLLAVGAILFNRPDFKTVAGKVSEPGLWIFGLPAHDIFAQLGVEGGIPLRSRAFPDSGLYLLQSGLKEDSNRISVVFDCGNLGFRSIAAHGHADALSFTLRAFGREIFIDPGTYDYFSFPDWRNYFRSTAAHNTLIVDGKDQSIMQGPFMWGSHAAARCDRWEADEHHAIVTAEHNGYSRLVDPVTHRRTLELLEPDRTLHIRDELVAEGSHQLEIRFHISEDCRVDKIAEGKFSIKTADGSVLLELDPRFESIIIKANNNSFTGWVSRGYHQKRPSNTIIGRCLTQGKIDLASKVFISNRPIPYSNTANH